MHLIALAAQAVFSVNPFRIRFSPQFNPCLCEY